MSADTSSPTFPSPRPFGLPRLRGCPRGCCSLLPVCSCALRQLERPRAPVAWISGRNSTPGKAGQVPGFAGSSLLQAGRQGICPSWLRVEAAWKVLGLESQHRLDPLPAQSRFQPCSCPLGPAGSLGAPTPGWGGWERSRGQGRSGAEQQPGPGGSKASRAGRRRAVRPRTRMSLGTRAKLAPCGFGRRDVVLETLGWRIPFPAEGAGVAWPGQASWEPAQPRGTASLHGECEYPARTPGSLRKAHRGKSNTRTSDIQPAHGTAHVSTRVNLPGESRAVSPHR